MLNIKVILRKNIPGMRSGKCTTVYEKSFPSKPASNILLHSNTDIYSNSQMNTQNHLNNTLRSIHDEDKIKKALKYIDNASKILKN